MSLFSVQSYYGRKIIRPLKVNIEGEMTGLFFAGTIEMQFINDDYLLDRFNILIGKNENNKICIHDFKIKIDENPYTLAIMEINKAHKLYEQMKQEGNQAVFGVGDDSYINVEIPNIMQNQIVTISVNFELPLAITTNNNISIFFPLTYPGLSNDNILKCSDFNFTIKFPSFPLNENSISSNPEGKIDLTSSSYHINSLDPTLTNISINVNTSTFSEDSDQKAKNFFNAEKGIATFCGKYGSLVFTPIKDNSEKTVIDHSGEEFIFIVDCSGSMEGIEIRLASECLIFFIKSLPEDCYFNVVLFGSKYSSLFKRPVPYNDSNSEKALKLAEKLEANLGGTVLSNPLKHVFSIPLSKNDKLRRVFVLTDGCVFDRSEVIEIVQENSNTSMCSAIGIGYAVDKELVKGIGEAGNGFVDFVLSGDDMRSKVINQLSESLNGLCKIDVSIENNENVEILPPLSSCRFSIGKPVTFYFKNPTEFEDDLHICIEIEGNSEPTIVEMKKLPSNSRAQKSLEYLFNNENIRFLRGVNQTDEVVSKIIQLSIEYGILTPYTGFVGRQEFISEQEKERIKTLMEQIKDDEIIIFVKTLTGEHIVIEISKNDFIEDLKELIYYNLGTPPDKQRLIFAGHQLEDGNTIDEYCIKNDSTVHMVLRLRGGGGPPLIEYAKRNFVSMKTNDLISIISEQKTKGYWPQIPSYLNNSKMRRIIQKVNEWSTKNGKNKKTVIGTLVSLIYIVKFKKECFQMWSLIYNKGIDWLKSIDSKIDWDGLIQKSSIQKFENDQNDDDDEEEEEEEEDIKELQKVVRNKIIYLLDDDSDKAYIIDNVFARGKVIIPQSVESHEHEFIVERICENAFKNSKYLFGIQFHNKSKIKTIENCAFLNSSIKSIVIPSSLTELKDGWCRGTSKLTNVTIAPDNLRFVYFDEKMIIAKTDLKSDKYDMLVFVRRDIKTIQIPSFIKKIGPFAFSQSELESIQIPRKVKYIDHYSFGFCEKLKSVEIPEDSKLQVIEKDAFEGCNIESFSVPERLKF